MELPLDTQDSGKCLNVDERVEQYCAVVGDLHVLARFVLVQDAGPSRYPHVQGGSTTFQTARFATVARRGWGERLLVYWWRIRFFLIAPLPLII
jgi:hypothetical protein